MRVGLKDVARRAGVSVKTVSNVVHGHTDVAPPTRERVQQALDELKYRPNLSARHLRSGRSGVIAVALPELNSPYFSELAGFIVKAAEKRSWTVLIDQTDGVREREQLVAEGIRAHLIDGLIYSPLALTEDDIACRADSTPLVLLGERVENGRADHVAIDNVTAARRASEHLVALGRTRIAAIGAQHDATGETARLRLAGWRAALEAGGLVVDASLVVPVRAYHREDGARAMRALLERPQPPDAVFCCNDLLALGALRMLHERGVRVPEEIAVAGFDDIEDGRFSAPSLTTISPDKAQIARVAVDLLADRLANPSRAPREVRADFALVVRESTAGVRP